MAKKTPEEREQAKLKRERDREELITRWPATWIVSQPFAELDTYCLISMEAGNSYLTLRIRKRGEWKKDTNGSEYFHAHLSLEQALELIHSLVSRYNSIVEEMNETASKIPVIVAPLAIELAEPEESPKPNGPAQDISN